MGSDSDHEVQATKTTLRVVEALDEFGGGGVTEIANHVGVSKSAVHKHLNTLSNYGYVTKTGDEYDVGLQFLSLGKQAQRRRALYDLGRPQLEHITNAIDVWSAVVVEENDRGVYLLVVGGDERESHPPVGFREGDQVSLSRTAAGKAILAHCSQSRIEGALETTESDVKEQADDVDGGSLTPELEAIRMRGVAFVESESGRRSVAAPIFESGDRVVGAIEVHGDADRLTSRRLENEVARLVDVTSQRVSKQLQLQGQ